MIQERESLISKSLGGGWIFVGLAAVVSSFIISGMIAYRNTQILQRNAQSIMETHEALLVLTQILSLTKDAETGQRGYIITGDEKYLTPFNDASAQLEGRLDEVERIASGNPDHFRALSMLRASIDAKMRELQETIDLRRTAGFEAALGVVVSDRGKAAMDSIRTSVESMQQIERQSRNVRIREMESAYDKAVASGLISTLVGSALTVLIAFLLRQSVVYRTRQERLLNGQLQLNQLMSGDQLLDSLSDNVLKFLVGFLRANAGAFFALENGSFRKVATYGVPRDAKIVESFTAGEGLLGQAAKDGRRIEITDIPEGYLTFGSAFGNAAPKHLAILPISVDSKVIAVIELGFLKEIDESTHELFDRAAESIGTSLRSVNYRAHLQELLEETQRQSEELQAQGEELRVSNEELEEQSRALRDSQVRLENQQAELETTNSQLEEQTQLLELERDEVTRSRTAVEIQAQQLEAASRYKSEFLANMSHELRTPLNSSLILAKLLADNAGGNLTTEQVQYAETIQSAGNDLLILINDILDLSKIEAGHLEIRPEPFPLKRLIESLDRTFRPIAEQKKLQLEVVVADDSPLSLETDRQRLEQILKNLLSNACKFTEAGQVRLMVRRSTDSQICFTVADTGIGISEENQQIVFDAFRQADSQISRKFGGTGLGLSISRELARLLGGSIHLTSEVGQGSEFTLTIPEVYVPTTNQTRPLPSMATQPNSEKIISGFSASNAVIPMKNATAGALIQAPIRPSDRRLLLIVEDDASFSRILEGLARDIQFESVVAATAEDGFALAIQWIPSAVILDLGLPDHSGLWVLDRLKHDARTRHIPVHVVSASEATESALALGAVGYLLKPVQKDELTDALQQLVERLSDRTGKVLVIEDDPVQLASVRQLLASLQVETVGAASAAEALEQLRNSTFDCMVLDLSLPDATGLSLLQTLSEEEAYAFPPVIVYTGRELSTNEEQQLRRYSKSIIIKGAKSPERLLDEVTLFLHRVVSELPPEHQRMLERAHSRDAALENRRVLVVEDDVRNVFALTSLLEPRGAKVEIARNGREALEKLEAARTSADKSIDLVLMDVMMPEMDGLTAVRKIRASPDWTRLPVIMLTAKAMKDDQENCLAAGANDYMAKPIDVEKLLSLIRVWMPR